MRRFPLLVCLPALAMASGCIFGDYLVSDYTAGTPACIGIECGWSRRYGDGQPQVVDAVAIGADGSVYFAGKYDGLLDLGGGKPKSVDEEVTTIPGDAQPYVAKLDSSGAPQWIHGIKVAGEATAVNGESFDVIPVSDGVLSTGYVYTALLQRQLFVRKDKPDGTDAWMSLFGGMFGDEGRAIAVSGSMIYVAGTSNSSGKDDCFKDGTYAAGPPGSTNLFLAAYDKDGACQWAEIYPGGDQDPGTIDVAVASNGHLVVTGHTKSGFPPGGDFEVEAGGAMFLLDVDATDGRILPPVITFTNARPSSMVVDSSSGNVFISGTLSGSLVGDMGATQLTGDTAGDWFILARTPELKPLWRRSFPGTNTQGGMKLATSPAGALLAVGTTIDSVDTGNGFSSCENGKECVVLLQLDGQSGMGSPQNALAFGIHAPTVANTPVAIGYGFEGLVLGASWDAPLNFTGTDLQPDGATDIFVAKWSKSPIP